MEFYPPDDRRAEAVTVCNGQLHGIAAVMEQLGHIKRRRLIPPHGLSGELGIHRCFAYIVRKEHQGRLGKFLLDRKLNLLGEVERSELSPLCCDPLQSDRIVGTRDLRSIPPDPLSVPFTNRRAECGRIAPSSDPATRIPETNLPDKGFAGLERAPVIDNPLGLIRLHPTGIPENLTMGIQDHDLIRRLVLVFLLGNFLPAEAGFCRANAFRISTVFATQTGNRYPIGTRVTTDDHEAKHS